jgi:protein SDA1
MIARRCVPTATDRNDPKTVSIMALGCFHPVLKVQSASLHFFLGSEDDQPDSDDDEDNVSLHAYLPNLAMKKYLRGPMSNRSSTGEKSTRKLVAATRSSSRA